MIVAKDVVCATIDNKEYCLLSMVAFFGNVFFQRNFATKKLANKSYRLELCAF